MKKTLFVVFVYPTDEDGGGAVCLGVYDSLEKCEDAMQEMEKQAGYSFEERHEILETELNELGVFTLGEGEEEYDEEE